MEIRPPFRAGMFYPADEASCRQEAKDAFSAAPSDEIPSPRALGGIAPHAGWAFSGPLAAGTIRALIDPDAPPTTVILFGADHVGRVNRGEVWTGRAWRTPLGDVEIDTELAAELLERVGPRLLRSNPAAHEQEHSIEVQVPLLAFWAPGTKIVPIAMPPDPLSIEAGEKIGDVLADRPGRVVLLGSSDLTHIGGHFGPPPDATLAAEPYARKNDRRMLDRIEALDATAVLTEAAAHHNACGPGAIAATIAATKKLGATPATTKTLHYTNSAEILRHQYPTDRDDATVGYASVVFGSP